jgi:dihydroflavonol-4-reductase
VRVLVLGGSGLIGNAIVRRFVADECRVTAVGRRPDRPPNLQDIGADYVTADVGDGARLDRLVGSHDVVVDAAAPYPLNLFHAATPADRNPVEHSKARMEALLSSAQRHGTALAYIGTPQLRQGSELRAAQSRFVHRLQPYFEVKRVLEEQVRDAVTHGLRTVIVRPSACLGPWDTRPRLQCWLPALVRGEIPVVLQHRLNVVDSRDVADALVGALRSASYGADISVVGHNTSTDELFSLACDLAGVSRPRWSMPAELAVFPAVFAELAWAFVGSSSLVPSLVLMLLCEQEWADSGPALTRRPLTETLRDALGWYRSLGYC